MWETFTADSDATATWYYSRKLWRSNALCSLKVVAVQASVRRKTSLTG